MISKWYGDNQNGLNVRSIDGEVDELRLFKDGECIVHIEQMDDTFIWMACYINDDIPGFQFQSKSGRAKVEIREQ